MEKVIAELYEVIKGRKEGGDEKSYTSYLFTKGIDNDLPLTRDYLYKE